MRCKLRLGMAWWHIDNQPLQVTFRYPIEHIRHRSVVITFDKGAPHGLDKRKEVALTRFSHLCQFPFLQQGQNMALVPKAHLVDLVRQRTFHHFFPIFLKLGMVIVKKQNCIGWTCETGNYSHGVKDVDQCFQCTIPVSIYLVSVCFVNLNLLKLVTY